jgi:hypothetical protein
MGALSVDFAVSADGRSVAEAEVGDLAAARQLIAAGAEAGAQLVWAHSAVDLSSLGFCERPGYRRLAGLARPGPVPDGVIELAAEEDTAELWAAAFRGQWGHKTAGTWPVPELAASTVLGLRRGGVIVGVCRVTAGTGCIDAPGLIAGQEDQAGYQALLAAGLARIAGRQVTVESWGDGPDRVRACSELGLATVEYCPGWELDQADQPGTP